MLKLKPVFQWNSTGPLKISEIGLQKKEMNFYKKIFFKEVEKKSHSKGKRFLRFNGSKPEVGKNCIKNKFQLMEHPGG